MTKQEKKKNITRKEFQEMREIFTDASDIASTTKINPIRAMMHSMFFEDVGMIEANYIKQVHHKLITERYHQYRTIEIAIEGLEPMLIQ